MGNLRSKQYPSFKEIKKLCAKSKNQCAFPECYIKLFSEEYCIGEICHIKGNKPNSPRFDENQSDSDRQAWTNLIMLCPTHHALTIWWVFNKRGRLKGELERYISKESEMKYKLT
jgi:hypothetical protein